MLKDNKKILKNDLANQNQQLYNEFSNNELSDQNENKSLISKNWLIKKNLFSKSNRNEKKFKNIKNASQKIGRYMEVNSNYFYKISIFDFLPFFIGSVYCLVKLFAAYGEAKKTITFDKKIAINLRNNFLLSICFSLIILPVFFIIFFFFYPYIMQDNESVIRGWYLVIENENLGTGINLYFEKIISKLLDKDNLKITLGIWIPLTSFNIQTFFFFFLFSIKKRVLFNIQKNNIRKQVDSLIKK